MPIGEPNPIGLIGDPIAIGLIGEPIPIGLIPIEDIGEPKLPEVIGLKPCLIIG